jgi:PKD repeat protein
MKKIIFSSVIGLMLVTTALLTINLPPAGAQPSAWPTTWMTLSTDPDESGGNNHRDVVALYYAADSQYLYLRMGTVASPGWPSTMPSGEARYKWWFNTGGTAAYLSGTTVHNAEFQLILEDRTNTSNVDGSRDRLGELTLIDDLQNVGFTSRWNQGNKGWYITNTPNNDGVSSLWKRALGSGMAGTGGPQGVMSSSIGYRIDNTATGGSFADVYISWAALGNPSSLCVIWATDNHDSNLDQAPNLDRPEGTSCIPVCVPLNADFHASNTSVCVNKSVDFTDDSTGSPTNWNWTFGDGGTSTAQDPTYTYANAGTYTVSLSVSNACFSDTETKTNCITVYAKPTATASSNSPVCEGATIELYGGPNGMASYNWTGPNGFSSNLQNPTIPNATTAMAGTYTLTVTNANGCSHDESTSVTVNTKPAATASSNSPVCEGATIELYGGPNGMASYNWTGPNAFSSSLQNPTIPNATLAIAGTYTLAATNSNGCSATNSTNVTVNTKPTCHITPDPDTRVCAGNNVTLTEDGGHAVSWDWTTGATTQSITVSTSGTYGVTITDADGCTSYGEIEITVIECAGPLLTITKSASPNPVQLGGTLTYIVTVTNTGGANAAGVTIVDDYDQTVLTIVNAGGGIDDGDTITWDGGITIPAREQISYTITATVSSTARRGSTFYNAANVTCGEEVSDSITMGTTVAEALPPRGGGGGGCSPVRHLMVGWDGTITGKPIYSNDRLAVDLLVFSPDGKHSLLLKRGTLAPIVNGERYYLITIGELELEDIPALPANTRAIVAVNITPTGAVFDRDITLTLGFTQLPENASNVTMAYYDDFDGVWVPLESTRGERDGTLTMSATQRHFSIYGVLAEVVPTPSSPAHFAASGLSIVPGLEKTWEPFTIMTKTGESVTIAATITNDGGQPGTYTVELELNGETVDTKAVTLGAGQSQQVTFTRSGLDYGKYDVQVAGLSGEFTASLTIARWLIVVIVVAVGLIIWAVVSIRRRLKTHHAA